MPILAPEPWHTISMDFVERSCNQPKVTGRTHYLVIVDKFSKYVMLELCLGEGHGSGDCRSLAETSYRTFWDASENN